MSQPDISKISQAMADHFAEMTDADLVKYIQGPRQSWTGVRFHVSPLVDKMAAENIWPEEDNEPTS